jgi:hypothetical protein
MRGGRGVLKYKTKTRKKRVLTLALVIEKSRCFDPTSIEKGWSLTHPCTLPRFVENSRYFDPISIKRVNWTL